MLQNLIGRLFAPGDGPHAGLRVQDDPESSLVDRGQIVYGSAWKELRAADLIYEALKAGHRVIDTAAQPRHYREDLLAEGLRRAIRDGIVSRDQIHIQTKFSPATIQDDDSIPYNSNDSIGHQVAASIETSLQNFRLDRENDTYLDTVFLHSLLPDGKQTLEAWAALEEFVPQKIGRLGISNITVQQLEVFYKIVKIKPDVVQNRFHRVTKFDNEIRSFCLEKNIQYQGYWILKKNSELLRSTPVLDAAERVGVSQQAVLFFLLQNLGISVLDGAADVEHIRDNMEGLQRLGAWMRSSREEWESLKLEFMKLLL